MCRDLLPRSIFLLIHHRLVPANLALAYLKYQFPMGVPPNPPGPANFERDAVWVGSRRHDEVILQLPLVAVVDQVNARIDSLVLHLRVGRNIRAPLRRIVADEVVARPRQFIHASYFGGGIGIAELHPQHACDFLGATAGFCGVGQHALKPCPSSLCFPLNASTASSPVRNSE